MCEAIGHLGHKSCHCFHHTHAMRSASWSWSSVAAVGHRPAHCRSHSRPPKRSTGHGDPLQKILETKEETQQREVKAIHIQIFNIYIYIVEKTEQFLKPLLPVWSYEMPEKHKLETDDEELLLDLLVLCGSASDCTHTHTQITYLDNLHYTPTLFCMNVKCAFKGIVWNSNKPLLEGWTEQLFGASPSSTGPRQASEHCFPDTASGPWAHTGARWCAETQYPKPEAKYQGPWLSLWETQQTIYIIMQTQCV